LVLFSFNEPAGKPPNFPSAVLSFADQEQVTMVVRSALTNAKYTLASIAFMVGSLAMPTLSMFGQNGANPKSDKGPVGIWRGESRCVVRPSACNDETALYRIAASPRAQDRLMVSGGKIVDGREVSMGSSECSYTVKTQVIDCYLPNGSSVHLEVKGDTIEGTYTLRDGKLWRNISLQRAEQK
jgi:hypothetical protein